MHAAKVFFGTLKTRYRAQTTPDGKKKMEAKKEKARLYNRRHRVSIARRSFLDRKYSRLIRSDVTAIGVQSLTLSNDMAKRIRSVSMNCSTPTICRLSTRILVTLQKLIGKLTAIAKVEGR